VCDTSSSRREADRSDRLQFNRSILSILNCNEIKSRCIEPLRLRVSLLLPVSLTDISETCLCYVALAKLSYIIQTRERRYSISEERILLWSRNLKPDRLASISPPPPLPTPIAGAKGKRPRRHQMTGSIIEISPRSSARIEHRNCFEKIEARERERERERETERPVGHSSIWSSPVPNPVLALGQPF